MACKCLEGTELGLAIALVIEAEKRGQTLCDTCDYDFKECPKSTFVRVGPVGYRRTHIDREMPVQKAWCKTCARESARPIAYVNFNRRVGIVVECERCHERYVMYESMYIERYVGRHTPYGYIPPTHGQRTALPRDIKMKMDNARKQRMKETDKHLASIFGYTEEQFAQQRKKWNEERAITHKKIEQQEEERHNSWKQQQVIDKAKTKSQLIKEGIIKYDKSARCLIDTRTGEVVKL